MASRGWVAWVLAIGGAVAACSLTVGKADLESVQCSEDQAIGPPACDNGQICVGGRCQRCAAVDLCGDGLDNDCLNGPDDGCSGSGNGGTSQGGSAGEGGGLGGQGGLDASDDQSAGGSSGQGGSSGGGQGGASGTGGDSGSAGAGGDIPDVVETGPVLSKTGQDCLVDSDCEPDLFCAPGGGPASGKCSHACCTSGDCKEGTVCLPGHGGAICAPPPGPVGMTEPGAWCDNPGNCRSGRCEGNRCQDTCCAESNCKDGRHCSLADYKGLWAWQCVYWADKHTGTYLCSGDEDCKSDWCGSTGFCQNPCCSGTCTVGDCMYYDVSGSAVRACGVGMDPVEACCKNDGCGGKRCKVLPAGSYSALQCE